MTDLISAEEVPAQKWRFKPCYGYRHRTVSYPQAKRRPEFEANTYPMCQGLEIWSDYHLLQFQAMQIGRAPFFIQQGDDQFPARCFARSIRFALLLKPFPWINHPEPLSPDESREFDDYLQMGDTGASIFRLTRRVTCTPACRPTDLLPFAQGPTGPRHCAARTQSEPFKSWSRRVGNEAGPEHVPTDLNAAQRVHHGLQNESPGPPITFALFHPFVPSS